MISSGSRLPPPDNVLPRKMIVLAHPSIELGNGKGCVHMSGTITQQSQLNPILARGGHKVY